MLFFKKNCFFFFLGFHHFLVGACVCVCVCVCARVCFFCCLKQKNIKKTFLILKKYFKNIFNPFSLLFSMCICVYVCMCISLCMCICACARMPFLLFDCFAFGFLRQWKKPTALVQAASVEKRSLRWCKWQRAPVRRALTRWCPHPRWLRQAHRPPPPTRPAVPTRWPAAGSRCRRLRR